MHIGECKRLYLISLVYSNCKKRLPLTKTSAKSEVCLILTQQIQLVMVIPTIKQFSGSKNASNYEYRPTRNIDQVVVKNLSSVGSGDVAAPEMYRLSINLVLLHD